MRLQPNHRAIPLAFCILVISVAQFSRADTLFTLNSPNPFRNSSWIFGNVFTVGATNLSVSALGAFDDLGNGFVTSGGIAVGLYEYSSGNLLASKQVLSSDTLITNYRYGTIAPVTLLAGNTYEVVAVNMDDKYDISASFSVSPLVAYNGYRYSNGTVLSFQGAGATFSGPDQVWMGNLQFTEGNVSAVPLPPAVWGGCAMLSGFVAIRARRRTIAA